MIKRFLLSLLTMLVLLCAVHAVFAGDGSDQFVLLNPSFEVSNEQDGAADWNSDPDYFTVTTEETHTGNASLKWSGDGREYKLCSQSTHIVPGTSVVFSVWIKTKDMKDGNATVCLEWMKKDGSWYGGEYAPGVTGTTNEWVKVSCQTQVPEDAVSPHITCYATKAASGTAWFDDVEITPYFPPLFSGITTNRYRGQSVGGNVDIFVGYTPTDTETDFTTLLPELTILDDDGNKMTSDVTAVSLVEAGDDFYRFSFDSTSLDVGHYTLTCSMTDPHSQELETISTSFTRLEQFPERVSYIDENLRLIHEGGPFFPLGLYLHGASDDEIELFADSPFNCVMPYASIDRDTLDKLFEHGIKTIYSVKDNFPGLNSDTMEQANAKTAETVEALRDHPGILAWYINDELPITMVNDLTARRDQMEMLDPGRPTWVVLYQVNGLRSYLSTFDVIGSDPYPIPSGDASRAAEWTHKTFDAGFGCRAVWQVPQIFNWACYQKEEEAKKQYRAPTFAEMRGMSWMCIAEGANGLIYYSFFDLQRMSKTEAEGGRALVPEPFDIRWGEVKTIAQEIADQFPILLSAEKTLNIKPAAQNSPDVSWRLFGTAEGTWILAVNRSDEEQTAKFQLPDNTQLVETRLGSPATQSKNCLTVKLLPFEPRLMRCRCPQKYE